MPCNSDYMNPTTKESQLQKTAELLVFVLESMKIKVSEKLKKAANNMYCTDDYVEELCQTLTFLTDSQKELIIYDAHNEMSRELATWWERHQEADKQREQMEKEKARLQRIKEVALSKLTLAEQKALGL